MKTPKFGDVSIGDRLPELKVPPVSRTTLALYAGASGDHNPIHIDLDFARKARMPDVFAHGMLSVAYLGRLLAAWVPQEQHRKLSVRFVGITQLGHQPTCSGTVVDKFEEGGEKLVKVALRCTNQHGEDRIVGEAVVALS